MNGQKAATGQSSHLQLLEHSDQSGLSFMPRGWRGLARGGSLKRELQQPSFLLQNFKMQFALLIPSISLDSMLKYVTAWAGPAGCVPKPQCLSGSGTRGCISQAPLQLCPG